MDEVLAVLSQTADGVYAIDQAQRIIFWNAAAERMLGYRADDVIGRPCHEIFHGEPRPGCLQCQPDCPVTRAASRHASVPTLLPVEPDPKRGHHPPQCQCHRPVGCRQSLRDHPPLS